MAWDFKKSNVFTVSNLFIVILVGLLSFGSWLFSQQLTAFHEALGAAKENFRLYQEAKSQLAALEKTRTKETAKIEQRQVERKKTVQAKHKAIDKKVQEVTRPDLNLGEVANLAEIHLGELPIIVQNKLLLSQGTVQKALALELKVEGLEVDLAAIKEDLADEKYRSELLQISLDQSNQNLKQADRTIESYQKVVKKGKWRIVLDVGQKVGLLAAGLGIGALLN